MPWDPGAKGRTVHQQVGCCFWGEVNQSKHVKTIKMRLKRTQGCIHEKYGKVRSSIDCQTINHCNFKICENTCNLVHSANEMNLGHVLSPSCRLEGGSGTGGEVSCPWLQIPGLAECVAWHRDTCPESMELCWWSQSYCTYLIKKTVSLGTVQDFPVNFIHIRFRLAYPDRDSFRAIGALDRTGDGRLHFFEFLGAMIGAGRIQPLSTKSCLKWWFCIFLAHWYQTLSRTLWNMLL